MHLYLLLILSLSLKNYKIINNNFLKNYLITRLILYILFINDILI